MKLSIITPIFRESRYLEKYLSKLMNQTNKNFEIIFVVDTNHENILEIIDDFISEYNGTVKIVFNTKRKGRFNALIQAKDRVAGDYVLISSLTDSFRKSMVDDLLKLATKNKADIIEFNARFYKPIWFEGTPRKIFNKSNFNKRDIFAYTYPFEFNKIFKKDVFVKAISLPKISKDSSNSRFSVELLFKSILLSSSYHSEIKKIIRTKKSESHLINSVKITNEWKKIIDNDLFDEYKGALKYNELFAIKMFYLPFAFENESLKMQEKLRNIISKSFNDEFFSSNVFLLKNTKEVRIFKTDKKNTNVKLYKEL